MMIGRWFSEKAVIAEGLREIAEEFEALYEEEDSYVWPTDDELVGLDHISKRASEIPRAFETFLSDRYRVHELSSLHLIQYWDSADLRAEFKKWDAAYFDALVNAELDLAQDAADRMLCDDDPDRRDRAVMEL